MKTENGLKYFSILQSLITRSISISSAYAVPFRQVLKSLNLPFVCTFARQITGSAATLMIPLPAPHQKSAWSPPIVAQWKTETDCLCICWTRCSARPTESGDWRRVGSGTHWPGPASRWSSFVYGTCRDLASSMAHSSSIVCSWIQCTPSRKPFCSGESHPFPISTTVVREAGEEFVDRREERSAGSCCNHRSNPSCKWRWNGETFQQLGTPSRHTAAYKTSSRRHIKSRQEMSLYSTPSTPGAVFDALLSFAMIIVLVGRLARYSCGPVAVVVFGSNL